MSRCEGIPVKQLFVHIGMSKAGSTAIQTAFADGRQNLIRHGVHYLSLMQNHSRLFHYVLDTECRMRRDFNLPHIEGLVDPSPDELRSAMIAELRDTPASICVLSGEGLFDLHTKDVEKLAACLRPTFDQIKIVAYVREPITWATSRAQQYIKKRTTTLAKLYDPVAVAASQSKIVPNYRDLEGYVSVFGLENVLVRALDRSTLVGGDLLRDFCSVIGRPEAADALVSRRSNRALSAEAVLLMDAYNQLMVERGAAKKRKPTTMRRHLEDLPGTPFALPRALLEEVAKATASDLAWLEETFGVALKLSPLPEKEQRPAWGPEVLRALVLRMEDGPPERPRKPKTSGPAMDWSRPVRIGAGS